MSNNTDGPGGGSAEGGHLDVDVALVTISDVSKVHIRVGRVIAAASLKHARRPAIALEIDFGPLGVKTSSAQLTRRYQPEILEGTQVLAVTNLPPRRVAGFVSEVLVLGIVSHLDPGDVVLVRPDAEVPLGSLLA